MYIVTELCVSSLDLYTGSKAKKKEAIANGWLRPMSESLLVKILSDVSPSASAALYLLYCPF
jgi:hypothetical protein